jgi:hypothetical protein
MMTTLILSPINRLRPLNPLPMPLLALLENFPVLLRRFSILFNLIHSTLNPHRRNPNIRRIPPPPFIPSLLRFLLADLARF